LRWIGRNLVAPTCVAATPQAQFSIEGVDLGFISSATAVAATK
jgi:hypothetical protein